MSIALTPEQIAEIQKAIRRGLKTLERPQPLRLSEWAAEHFYLSAESSYIEGRWEAYPYQVAIMDCISNDDIREVTWIKSARTGYTKIILAAMGYFAEHKKRNQAVWQPVDDDADEFCKTELEPAIRDVAAWRNIFPWANSKHKNNTLRQKVFTTGTLHIRGGKAAKNYRRISIDVGYLDELDGFDRDVEREGDPRKLAKKRVEGATFPKMIYGSTPKVKHESLIEESANHAALFMRYHIPCVHCQHEQPLRWGGKDDPFGFKWDDEDPNTVRYLCEHCGESFTQADYLNVWHEGRYIAQDGTWIDPEGFFRTAGGEIREAPISVAFHVWTAYSPQTSWEEITREFLAAENDTSTLKTFVNTTLGETWEEDSDGVESNEVMGLREDYQALYGAEVPPGVEQLTMGVDIQGDRIEYEVVGWGEGDESWSIDYQIIPGDTTQPFIWDELEEALHQSYMPKSGVPMCISAVGIDSGAYTQHVYDFVNRMRSRTIFSCKGYDGQSRPIVEDQRKRLRKRRRSLSDPQTIGVDAAKTLIYANLKLRRDGPGRCHFPIQYDEEYFAQLTAERVVTERTKGYSKRVWIKTRTRNEALDCRVYALAARKLLPTNRVPVQRQQQTPTPTKRQRGGYLAGH